MSNETVENVVAEELRKSLPPETPITRNAVLEALGMTSILFMSMIGSIALRLDIELEPADLQNVMTVQDVYDAVERARKAAVSA